MTAVFHCQYCPPPYSNDCSYDANHTQLRTFASQKDFVNHLKEYHLIVKATHNGKVYICRYGPSNSCPLASPSSPDPHKLTDNVSSTSAFSSQRDYEQHLVFHHLLRVPPSPQVPVPVVPSSNSVSCRSNGAPTCAVRWGVLQSTVNLPAALNDPIYRQTDIFSRTWGEQFERAEVLPSPKLPVITEKHFERYLSKLSSRGTFLNGPRSPQRNVILQAVRGSTVSREFPTSSSTVHEDDISRSMVALDSIPSLLFDSDFNLQNVRTFAQLIPLHPRPVASNKKSLQSTNADWDTREVDLQQLGDFRAQHDRLAHYLDIVEVHLADQVSKKSSIFFEAVCCHDIVREQLIQALSQIKLVREKLRQVDDCFTYAAIRLHRLMRRKGNYRVLLEKLELIASLQAAQPTIQLLLRTSDFCGALDLVASTQELLHSCVTQGSCATTTADESQQIVCLRHFAAQLNEISRFVRHMIEAEFEAALRQFFERQPADDQYTGPALVSCLLGLLHIGRHDFVSAFRAELLHQVKSVQSPQNLLVNGTTESDKAELRPPADPLRGLPNANWLQTISDRCSALKTVLGRGEEAINIFIETMSNCLNVPATGDTVSVQTTHLCKTQLTTVLTQDNLDHLTSQLRLALRCASSIAQKQIGDLMSIGTRPALMDSSDTVATIDERPLERLTMQEFVELLNTLDDFQQFVTPFCFHATEDSNGLVLTDTETKSDPAIPARATPDRPTSTPILGRFVVGLVHTLVGRFHRERAAKLEMMLSQERWQAVPVPARVQHLVDETFGQRLNNRPKSGLVTPTTGALLSHTKHTEENGVCSSLTLGVDQFVVVGTVLLLLPMLLDYVHLAERLPGGPQPIQEVAARLAELLILFNSRTCQLVLGAEARRSADLPTISARNLALTSRSVQLIAQCVPIIQSRFDSWIASAAKSNESLVSSNLYYRPRDARRCPPLQHVVDLFQEHVCQINDKLFNLLSNRIHDRLSVWHVRPPTPSTELKGICIALDRMAKMTNDVLPVDQLTQILLRAHNEFKAHMRHRLRELAVVPDGGPNQSLVDQELTFYINQFRKFTPRLAKYLDDFSDIWSCA